MRQGAHARLRRRGAALVWPGDRVAAQRGAAAGPRPPGYGLARRGGAAATRAARRAAGSTASRAADRALAAAALLRGAGPRGAAGQPAAAAADRRPAMVRPG